MAVHAKEVKHRLNSIKNTQKITKAMELVAAAKMRKAVAQVTMSRNYSALAFDIVRRLAGSVDISTSPIVQRFLTTPPENARVLLVVFSSNRGLCGAFNSHVVRASLSYMRQNPKEHVSVASIGKRGANMFGTAGITVPLIYEKDDKPKDDTSIINIADILLKQFERGEVDKVVLAYTDYHSPVHQTAITKQLFPLSLDDIMKKEFSTSTSKTQCIYEPSQKMILEMLLPRMAQVQLYQALLESNASEHSSRMLAMKNATDAAGDMADDLVLLFNRARQASITKEIAEISSAVAALT